MHAVVRSLEREALERGKLSERLICIYALHEGVVSSSRKYPVISSEPFVHNYGTSYRTKCSERKEFYLSLHFLCFPGVISAPCPRSRYSDLEDTLQSPGYSTGKYPPKQTCTYDIRVPAGKRIILTFNSINILGSMPNCPQDSLEIIVG